VALDSETRELLNFLDRIDQEATARRNDVVGGDKKWDQYLRVYRGKTTVPVNNPFFQANIIGVEIERKAATLAENKPELRVSARRDGIKATADILQRTIRADWDEQNVSGTLETGCLHMGIFGSQVLGIQWDRTKNYGLGGLMVFPIDPRNFRMDPAITYPDNLDDAQYVIVDSLEPLANIRRNYPGVGVNVPPDPRASLFPTNDSPNRTGFLGKTMDVLRGRGGSTPNQGGAMPRGYIREYWIKPWQLDDGGQLIFPWGRHVIRGGSDVILHDGPNPYFDGAWPFVMCNGRTDPDHPWGRSEVEGLRRIGEAVNRLGHLFVDGTIRSGNPKVIMDNDALTNDEKNKLSNIGAILINKRFGREIKYEAPGAMPTHFLDFIKFAMMMVDVLTGMSDSTAGGRKEIRSGAMLEGLQTAAQVLVRQQARRVEGMLERLGQKWISRIFQFYTDDRLMTMLEGPEFQQYQFERQKLIQELVGEASGTVQKKIVGEQQEILKQGGVPKIASDEERQQRLRDEITNTLKAAWKDFRFKITPGSSLSNTRTQRAMLYGELAKNGLMSPLRVLREVGVDNPEEEIAEAIKYLQMRQAAGLPMGEKPSKGKSKAPSIG
jgi:hypothetical protein